MEIAREKIRQILKKLDLPFAIASVAEDYVKRFAEAKYDRLAQTKIFKKLKNLEERERLMIELAFYSLNIFIKKNMPTTTPLGIFAQGIITDFFPEMGKRLINGGSSHDPDEQEVIQLVREPSKGSNYYAPKEKSGPGFFDGTSDLLRKKLTEYLDKN